MPSVSVEKSALSWLFLLFLFSLLRLYSGSLLNCGKIPLIHKGESGKIAGIGFAVTHLAMIGGAKRWLKRRWQVLIILSVTVPVYAYDEIEVRNGGAISGVVRFQGEVPKLRAPEVTKFKEVCKDVPNESLVIGPGKGIRYAVLALKGIARGKAVEREVVHELDNAHCRFVPHVQAASVGQFLVVKNSDPILHTAHAYFRNQPHFNVGLYPGRISRKPLVTPGVVKILCEVHPWMSAYIVVTEHPYHAVTDIYGEYHISDIPPGPYRLELWHETLGVQERPVEVKAGATAKIDFELSPLKGEGR